MARSQCPLGVCSSKLLRICIAYDERRGRRHVSLVRDRTVISAALHERRRGRAGAKLRVRIVGQFSVIAAAPAVLLAVFASITLDRGLDHWFSTRTYTIIANSLTVAEAYMREHVAMIRGDILAMANDLARAKPLFDQNRERFRQFLNGQASIRGLPLALIIRSDLSVVERVDLQGGGEFIPPPIATLKQQGEAEPSIALLAEAKTVAAVTKLSGYDDSYLYVARPVDPRVVAQLQATQEGVAEYATLQAARPARQAVCGHRPHLASLGRMDWDQFCQSFGRAHSPTDWRCRSGFDRQSPGAGADTSVRRRTGAARRDLQQHDPGAANPA